jgi:hypothetical protein
VRLLKFGTPKVETPSPPKLFPIKENNLVFSEIGSKYPSHASQPAGAKLKAKTVTSPMYGTIIETSSV